MKMDLLLNEGLEESPVVQWAAMFKDEHKGDQEQRYDHRKG